MDAFRSCRHSAVTTAWDRCVAQATCKAPGRVAEFDKEHWMKRFAYLGQAVINCVGSKMEDISHHRPSWKAPLSPAQCFATKMGPSSK
jgi:hypothetical protein